MKNFTFKVRRSVDGNRWYWEAWEVGYDLYPIYRSNDNKIYTSEEECLDALDREFTSKTYLATKCYNETKKLFVTLWNDFQLYLFNIKWLFNTSESQLLIDIGQSTSSEERVEYLRQKREQKNLQYEKEINLATSLAEDPYMETSILPVNAKICRKEELDLTTPRVNKFEDNLLDVR